MARRSSPGVSPRQTRPFAFSKGLNLITPHIMLKPGELIYGRNYEIALGGGYRRVDGYERFDGHTPKPSDALYERIAFDTGGNRLIQANDVITGATSGATATVVATPTLTAGAWATINGVGELSFTKRTGTFQAGENIKILGVVNCRATGTTFAGTLADADYKDCQRGAMAVYRALIAAVPGAGNVLGVWVFNGDVYAWRNNAGNTATVMFKATAGGWASVSLGSFIRYTAGVSQINEGDTITGGTSAATALVQRVNVASGNWGGPTSAIGRLAITNIVGTFQNGEALKVGGVTRATANGANTTNTLSPGGRFELVTHNFYGSTNKKRMYGCDGVNRAFEFDGTVFCFIETGMTTDTPNHIGEHKELLFLAFPGGSLQNSGVGDPLFWNPRLGASEIGMGDDVTAIYSVRNDTLAVFARNSIALLYGSSNSNFVLEKHADRIGALPYSVEEIDGQVVFTDNRGVFDLSSAQVFGDFEDVALSAKVKPLVIKKALTLKTAVLVRELSQVRLIFGDKTAITATFSEGKVVGWIPQTYAHQFVCAVSGEDASGNEVIYAGGDDGFVYQLNRGPNFDGTMIESLATPPYFDYASPFTEKHFHALQVQCDAPRAFNLVLFTEFDYGSSQSGRYDPMVVRGSGGLWDEALWNEFFWDGAVVSTPIAELDGWGLNMSPSFYHKDDVDKSFTLQAAQVVFTSHGQRP
jgi:hypothetical protein